MEENIGIFEELKGGQAYKLFMNKRCSNFKISKIAL
jgi:hypothetical protein